MLRRIKVYDADRKKNNDKTSLFKHLGGTFAEILAKRGKMENAYQKRLKSYAEEKHTYCTLQAVDRAKQIQKGLLCKNSETIPKTILKLV